MVRKKKSDTNPDPNDESQPPEAEQAVDSVEASVVGEPDMGFPIVGIGASAGGLAAFEEFFAAMPPDAESGMAFVLVQHLDPTHKSILSDLVKQYTRMQVYEVEDGMEVEPDCVYIIPPNRDMAFLHSRLHLMEPTAPRGMRLPIDYFFRSLAQDQDGRAICIVLSGTGTDGTLGLKAIKGEGGMAMVQSPDLAAYDGMPRSAIATGLVDYVLSPGEMPAQLIAYVQHAFGQKPLPVAPPVRTATDLLQKIFVLLRAQIGHDFSYYKQNTICRRIERRMAVTQIGRLDDYVRYLQRTPLEVEALFRDFLIGVTNFFRDPEAFEALERQVIPRLFEGKPSGGAVRVWVPGCSTGEEAYSIAILLREYTDELKKSYKVQVFATDIDSEAIEQARVGIYPDSIAADVSPERLTRFFVLDQDGSAYRIQKTVRDMLVFAEQDVIGDPPFSKLDLISCRNLLIYMGADLQKKVVPLFHYALSQDGFLFLGNSETVGEFVDLFAPVDRKWKLYQRRGEVSARLATMDFMPPLVGSRTPQEGPGKDRGGGEMGVRELTERTLLEQHTPACVTINEHGAIVYVHGRTGKYLEPAPGEFSVNILHMAREGLRLELATAIRRVSAHKEPVRYEGLLVKMNGGTCTVNLTVSPLAKSSASASGLMMVLFEDVIPEDKGGVDAVAPEGGGDLTEVDQRIAALERELRGKEEYLQTTIEELETSNEELKSTNEELQSSNEELQSTNEELETSKEELQSINEELVTVNTELQKKIYELSQVNNDMNNLLVGTGIGTVFVDHQLHIQRFTPAAAQVINLIQTDVGRPVGHIVSNLLGYDRLVEDVRAVLDTLVHKEVEVQAKDGCWYLMRILPYRTLENAIEGAVITFVDVTGQKRLQEELRESEAMRRLAAVVRDSNDAITVQDLEGRILCWNSRAERMYGWSEAEALDMNICDIVPGDKREEGLALMVMLGRGEITAPFHTQRITKDGETLDVWLTASALVNEAGEPYAIATTERDITGKGRET